MNATSRAPRLVVAERKFSFHDDDIVVRAAPRLPHEKPPPRRLTREDDADCYGLRLIWLAVSPESLPLRQKLSGQHLAEVAKLVGRGSKQRNDWSAYKNCRKRMQDDDKLLASLIFRSAPQNIFPSWPWPELTHEPREARYDIVRAIWTRWNIPVDLARRLRVLAAANARFRAG